ncbi:MAG: hypothetical protein Q4C95_06575 [Planctomycetia bacterium]|nr:hypothetical protein [Planctomycetia bacterium]
MFESSKHAIAAEGKILFAETIRIAQDSKAIKPEEMSRVIVDARVMKKNITFPTDAKLLYKAIAKGVKLAKHAGIKLRQTYLRKAQRAAIDAAKYVHAKQWKCNQRKIQDLKNWLGRTDHWTYEKR